MQKPSMTRNSAPCDEQRIRSFSARQEAVGGQRQRQAGMRAAVDVAADLPGAADDEAEEQFLARAEGEALRPGLRDVGEGAKARTGRRLRRIHGSLSKQIGAKSAMTGQSSDLSGRGKQAGDGRVDADFAGEDRGHSLADRSLDAELAGKLAYGGGGRHALGHRDLAG